MTGSHLIRRLLPSHDQRSAGAFHAIMLAAALPVFAQDPPETPAKLPDYAFKPIEIKPSPSDGVYEGRFLFINNTSQPVEIPSFDEPVGGRVVPQFLRYQALKDGTWSELEVGYCGLADQIQMEPHKAYEFVVSLGTFDESEMPVTGKIGVGDFWSEPFVMDWKKDRGAGKFAQARQENFAKVRAAFSKAGFKQELLEGDDFCFRLLQIVMNPSSGKAAAAAAFPPFVGRLNVVPGIGLDGKIRIDFGSDEIRDYDTEYRGWFSIDPAKFTPEWFRTAIKEHVRVSDWGDGIQMELDDGSAFDSPLFFQVICEPFDKSKRPSKEGAGKVFAKMLENLDGWLK